jgi:transcriptional regulator with XRE-family HTH domain
MNSEEIKKILKEKRIKITDIASDLGVSQPTVSLTIKGTTVSSRIRAAIAEACGKPVSEIWPDTKPQEEAA